MLLRQQMRPSVKSFLVVLHLASAIVLGSSRTPPLEYHAQAMLLKCRLQVSQFGHRAPVQLDGSITIPTIGTLDVEGELLSRRERIQAAFTAKLPTVYASDVRADTYRRARRRLGDRRTICSDLGIGRCCSTWRATLLEDDGRQAIASAGDTVVHNERR